MASSRRSTRKARYASKSASNSYLDEYEDEYGYSSEGRAHRSKSRAESAPKEGEEEEQPENEAGEEEEFEGENSGEVTRCICGNQELQLDPEDPYYNDEKVLGLFIQCDRCNVWQHGYCVSIYEEKAVPEKYWCEKCRPDLHDISVIDGNRTSMYKPVQPNFKKTQVNNHASNKSSKKLKSARPTRSSRHEENEDPKNPASMSARSKRTTMNSNDGMLAKVLRESAKEFKHRGYSEESEDAKEGGSSSSSRKKRSRRALASSHEDNGDFQLIENSESNVVTIPKEEEGTDQKIKIENGHDKSSAEKDGETLDSDQDKANESLKDEQNEERRKRPRRAAYLESGSKPSHENEKRDNDTNVEESNNDVSTNNNDTTFFKTSTSVPMIVTNSKQLNNGSSNNKSKSKTSNVSSPRIGGRSGNNSDGNISSSATNNNLSIPRNSRKKKPSGILASSPSSSLPSHRRANGASGKNSNTMSQNSIMLNSDKPIEPRIPPAKISLNEMRKRITAISEFIYYMSLDLSEEQKSYQKLLENFHQKINGGGAGSGNTSFASTASSAEDEEEEEKFIKNFQLLFENNQSGSMVMIDSLRSKIQGWESKFGSYEPRV